MKHFQVPENSYQQHQNEFDTERPIPFNCESYSVQTCLNIGRFSHSISMNVQFVKVNSVNLAAVFYCLGYVRHPECIIQSFDSGNTSILVHQCRVL